MTLVIVLWLIVVIAFLVTLKLLHRYRTGFSFGEDPGWDPCPTCGGDGGLVLRDGVLVRVDKGRRSPSMGPTPQGRGYGRRYRSQMIGHRANTPVWDCPTCRGRCWVPRGTTPPKIPTVQAPNDNDPRWE
jgi:hypothetical protein